MEDHSNIRFEKISDVIVDLLFKLLRLYFPAPNNKLKEATLCVHQYSLRWC